MISLLHARLFMFDASTWTGVALYSLAFFIGCLTGLSELLSRYAQSVREILSSSGGLTYILLNGAVAAGAYWAACVWGITLGLEGKSEAWRVILVAISSMAVFRSAFANLKIGDRTVGAGPVLFVEVFMKRAERRLDQQVGRGKYDAIAPLVSGLSYSKSKNYLAIVAEQSLRSVSAGEKEAFRQGITTLDKLEVDEETKMELFAMLLVDVTSIEFFARLVKGARGRFPADSSPSPSVASSKIQRLTQLKEKLR